MKHMCYVLNRAIPKIVTAAAKLFKLEQIHKGLLYKHGRFRTYDLQFQQLDPNIHVVRYSMYSYTLKFQIQPQTLCFETKICS